MEKASTRKYWAELFYFMFAVGASLYVKDICFGFFQVSHGEIPNLLACEYAGICIGLLFYSVFFICYRFFHSSRALLFTAASIWIFWTGTLLMPGGGITQKVEGKYLSINGEVTSLGALYFILDPTLIFVIFSAVIYYKNCHAKNSES